MGFLTRSKVYKKVEPHKDSKKIYILCEGQKREVDYFKYFCNMKSNIDIIPIPNQDGKSDPVSLKDQALRLFIGGEDNQPEHFLDKTLKDEVWIVIDTDRWNEGNKISSLREFVLDQSKKYKFWNICQSNTCFEVWLYYHLFDIKPDEEEVKKHKNFKAFLNSIHSGGFDSRKMPVLLGKATENSKRKFKCIDSQPVLYTTDLFKLGENILKILSEELKEVEDLIYKDSTV